MRGVIAVADVEGYVLVLGGCELGLLILHLVVEGRHYHVLLLDVSLVLQVPDLLQNLVGLRAVEPLKDLDQVGPVGSQSLDGGLGLGERQGLILESAIGCRGRRGTLHKLIFMLFLEHRISALLFPSPTTQATVGLILRFFIILRGFVPRTLCPLEHCVRKGGKT